METTKGMSSIWLVWESSQIVKGSLLQQSCKTTACCRPRSAPLSSNCWEREAYICVKAQSVNPFQVTEIAIVQWTDTDPKCCFASPFRSAVRYSAQPISYMSRSTRICYIEVHSHWVLDRIHHDEVCMHHMLLVRFHNTRCEWPCMKWAKKVSLLAASVLALPDGLPSGDLRKGLYNGTWSRFHREPNVRTYLPWRTSNRVVLQQVRLYNMCVS